ncbi:DUF4265 domain-containing protein [Catenovulum agarivorans]|uniref:DUF4265 domain-containing protein n=1 Tax=Catenovulum agarivorans TaxID=1172192 RepID=UPI0002E3F966|nr:DUF4265 domain-containing protein [Catenovulum agarivorans]
MRHIHLFVEGSEDQTQPVEVEQIGSNEYMILYSPGLVEGIAAGDSIKITNESSGEFEVVHRGGSVSIKLYSKHELANYMECIMSEFEALPSRFDGGVKHACVWTVDLSQTNFGNIERSMKNIMRKVPDSKWWYGNVYDANNKPLNWWKKNTS